MNTAFSRFSSPGQSLLLPKLLFVLCQLAGIAVGLYKCWSMGLLPPRQATGWLGESTHCKSTHMPTRVRRMRHSTEQDQLTMKPFSCLFFITIML